MNMKKMMAELPEQEALKLICLLDSKLTALEQIIQEGGKRNGF